MGRRRQQCVETSAARTPSRISDGKSISTKKSASAALAEKERALISKHTMEGLAAAKKRGVKLGGWNFGSERSQREADELVDRVAPMGRRRWPEIEFCPPPRNRGTIWKFFPCPCRLTSPVPGKLGKLHRNRKTLEKR
jgi:hypothetical protein